MLSAPAGGFGKLTTGVGFQVTNGYNIDQWNACDFTNDMTASQTLEVTLTLSVANANLEWKSYSSTLELLNP